MTKVRSQILEVMRRVYNEWKLNPEGASFLLWVGKLEDLPDYKAILRKLAEQYQVIKIDSPPNKDNLSNFDIEDGRGQWGEDAVKDLYSYGITVKPEFEAFYKKHYTDNSVNVPSLKRNNFFMVLDTADLIDDIINVTSSDDITLSNFHDGQYKKHIEDSNASHYEITQKAKKIGLEFLKAQNAIASFKENLEQHYDFNEERDVVVSYTVEINRHVFDEVYQELLASIDKYLTAKQPKEKIPETKKSAITFDAENGKLRNQDIALDVSQGTVEYFIVKPLFAAKIGQGTDVDDITEEWGGEAKGQTIYDAVTRLNNKFRQLLNTNDKNVKVVFQKSSKVYLDTQYSDSISTQK